MRPVQSPFGGGVYLPSGTLYVVNFLFLLNFHLVFGGACSLIAWGRPIMPKVHFRRSSEDVSPFLDSRTSPSSPRSFSRMHFLAEMDKASQAASSTPVAFFRLLLDSICIFSREAQARCPACLNLGLVCRSSCTGLFLSKYVPHGVHDPP